MLLRHAVLAMQMRGLRAVGDVRSSRLQVEAKLDRQKPGAASRAVVLRHAQSCLTNCEGVMVL